MAGEREAALHVVVAAVEGGVFDRYNVSNLAQLLTALQKNGGVSHVGGAWHDPQTGFAVAEATHLLVYVAC